MGRSLRIIDTSVIYRYETDENAMLESRGNTILGNKLYNHDPTVNDSPQPHASFILGFLNVNFELKGR